MTIKSVLFDLDGTLLDTAPDLAGAINAVRSEQQLPSLPLELLRPAVGFGASALIKIAFNLTETHPLYPVFLKDFLEHYEKRVCEQTDFFPGMQTVLDTLDTHGITWGIVTNKIGRFTYDILAKLKLSDRAGCVVCGDTLPKKKPDPDQLLHAARLIKQLPTECIYVGDSISDITASRAANMKSIVALYGYIHPDEDPHSWQATDYINAPCDLLTYLQLPQPA